MAAPIASLEGKYPGMAAWIVGSGPSLAWLGVDDFGPGPVIAINYAIEQVGQLGLENPIYSMQKDQRYVETRFPILSHVHESGKNGWGNFVFDNQAFGLAWDKPSLMSALSIASLWGCVECVCLCFDAVTRGDLQSFEGGKVITKECRGQYPIIGHWAKAWAKHIAMPVEWRLVWPHAS